MEVTRFQTKNQNKHLMIRKLYSCFGVAVLVLLTSFSLRAQQLVTGTVKDAQGTAMPGVNVLVKGTTNGTSTDGDGNFSLQASSSDVLVFSFIGYKTAEEPVGNRTRFDIVIEEDLTTLSELVVVGYGVQKKTVNTGANLQVEGESLQKLSTTNALQALQGQAPGVQITSTSGQPGSNIKVTIRGLGTISNASPLYVVDGVLTNDISYLNPADIETLTVLKDAASAAIYGSQAANGVVLVTTKTGKAGKAQLTFDAYYGLQNVPRKTGLLNAKEYTSIMNEAAVNSGKLPYFSDSEIAAYGSGTDWLEEMFVKDAPTQNYSLGASGGTEQSVYSTSFSYLSQTGIVGGRDLSNYERYNFRINSEHKVWKDIVTLGQHLNFAYTEDNGVGVGNQYNNTLRAAFNVSPLVPMYDDQGQFFDNSQSDWNNGEANPYASMVYNNQNRNNNQRLIGDIYMVVEPIKNLKYRTSLGIDYSAYEGRSYTPIYKLSIYSFNDITRVRQSMGKGKTWIWDNLLSYGFNIEDHSFDVMAGSSAYKSSGAEIEGSNTDFVLDGIKYAWLNNTTNTQGGNLRTLSGGPWDPDYRLSYFGRLNYNYKETYMLNATFRADGSSRFAKGNRWGYFPSVSAGWILTNEDFLANNNLFSLLKLRASWGQVGNQNVPPFRYLAPVTYQYTNYIFGNEEGVLTPGAYPSRLANSNLQWETSEQTNIGLDATILDGKLNIAADWYNKTTKDWLIQTRIPATAGAEPPYINGGKVVNKGVELALTYSSTVGDLSYTVGVNGSYNKNKVIDIPTDDGIIHGLTNQLFDNSLEFNRAETGHPIGYFWGLTTAGIFQTEADVANHRSSEGVVIQPNAKPGDVRYVDRNNDGTINDLDRSEIGSPIPDFTFGFNVSLNYKGFDLSILASGVAGNEIVQSYRNHSSAFSNYSTAILDRWTGPGSSNSVPRVTEDNRNWTNFSDLYIHDGSFLRLNNITLGYDFSKLTERKLLNQVRLYASVLNLYTFTKYNGMDPEVGFGPNDEAQGIGFSQGVDLGYYPRPRTVMLGLNVKF